MRNNVKDRVDTYTHIYMGGGEVFFKAIVENQMTCLQKVMYLHLFRGRMPMCMFQWGIFLGDSTPLQWLFNV